MRASVAVAAFVGAVAVALAQTPLSCTPVPTPATPTPTPTPWPSVNPAGLCPNVCPGWGTLQAGYQFFANNTKVSGAVKSTPNIDTADVLVTKATTSTGLWWIDQWQPGTYSLQYNVRDTCGRDSSTMAGYKATATLDYRCNNPPVVVARPAQQITTRYGAEVVLDATASFDFDQVDRTNLKFTWCLITRPTSFKDSTPYTTMYEDVSPFIHVPVGTAGAMNGVPLQGFALFKPQASGMYRFIVSVSDGCNVVQNEMRVYVTLTCCPHTAVANLQSNIQWSSQWVSAYSTMMDSFMTSNASCLPPDYVMASARTAGTVYKNLYSPVVSDYMNNTVYLDHLPSSVAPKPGCTWPGAKPAGSGAGAFDPAATVDDGSCQCTPNTDTWDVMTAPGSYVRRIDPTNTTAIVKTPGNLKFVTSLPSTQTWMSTCPQASETTWNNGTTQNRDIRVDTSKGMITVNPLLTRPSTSWDATVTFKVANATMKTYSNTNASTQTTTVGNTMCTVAVDTAPTGKNPTVTVTRGPGYDLKQCLGYYSFLLSSSNSDVCPLSTDQVDVEVVCPYPPFISLLCDVNYLLWDGSKFVKDTGAVSTTTPGDLLDGWVQLDARETTYSPNVQYSLSLTSQPAPLTYLGASAAGPAAGMPELNPGTNTYLAASNTSTNLTAAFLPTRQGTYEVTLWGDDGCNTKSYDSVLVSTQCLPISASASASPSPTAAAAPLTPIQFAINASYATLGTGGNLNNRLNYAIRLTSRPQLPMGDVGKYTGTGNDAASFECMLGASWSLAAAPNGAPGVLGLANAQKNTVIQGLAGTYTYAVTVLDACSRATDIAISSTAPACAFPNNVTGVYAAAAATQTVTWNNGGFATGTNPVPTLTLNVNAQATAPSGATVAWFMTGAPGTTSTKIYPSASPVAVAAGISCVSNQATSWSVGQYNAPAGSNSILRSTSDPYGPISSGTALTFNSYVLTQTTVGTHTFVAQPMGQCDATTVGFTVNTVCNAAARFVCSGSATCAAGFPNLNGPSQTKSYWNSAPTVNRYAPVFINSMADAGGDSNSEQDTLWFTTTLTAPNTKSWWSAAFFTETVSFTFSLLDNTDDLFQDATGYPNIVTAVRNSLQTTLRAYSNLGSDMTTRVFLANSDLATFITDNGGYANASLAAPLGVWVTGGCYTPGWGRTFTATATYAVIPPKHFRAFGSVLQSASSAEGKGYARTLTGLTLTDVAPLATFDTNLRADVPGMVGSSLTAAYAGARYAASSLSWVTPNPVITPNMFHFKTSVKTSSSALTAFVTTSFLPDVDGQFSTVGSVVDDCPSAANTPVSWPAATITVIPPACSAASLSGLALTQYDSATTNNVASNSITRQFSNSSMGFGPSWGYIGNAPAYNLTAGSSITTGTLAVCFTNFDANCGQKPTVTNGGSVSFTGTNNQQYQLAVIPLPANTNQGATIQFTYTGGANPTNGGELHIGCTQSRPVAGYTNTTAITWFYSVDSSTSAASAATFLLPADCLGAATGTPDLIFATFPSMTTNSQPSWSINAINIYSHPASYGAIAATASFSQMIAPQAATGFLPNINGTGSATGINLGNGFFAKSLGTTANLPSNQFTYTTAYMVSYSFPAWVTTTATCSGTSATTQVTLKCPVYTPDITVTQSAYNLTNWHFNPASVQWTGFQSWASQVNTDFSFTFQVTGAPAMSVLNAQNLAANILPAKLNTLWWTGYNTVTNMPNWSPVTQMCYSKSAIGQFANVNLTTWTRAFTGQTNTSWAAWIDPSTVSVTLAPGYPSGSPSLPWIATNTLNGEYYKEYYNQLGQASFIPDATTDGSSSYTVVTTLNDRCNPIVTKTATISVPCINANGVTVSRVQLGAAASIGDAGSGRVMLKGTVNMPNGAAVFAEDAHVRKITWTVVPVGAPSWVPPVKVYDADTLYPSFVPVWAGQYTVVLSVDIGNGCGPISSTSNTLSVACAVSATPVPAAVVAQGSTTSSTAYQRIGQNGYLTIPYLPNTGANQDNIYWIGEATCPVMASWWNAAPTVAYTCPTTQYSVRLVSFWPPVLMTNVNSQTVQLTVAIGSTGTTTPGIPQGLIDAIYYQQTLDANAISIKIGGVTCTSPYVTDAANGKIICVINGVSYGSAPTRVTATILGVNSVDVNGDLWVPLSQAPTVTGVAGTAGLPTTGGNVIISGYNLAFPMYDPTYTTASGGPNWSPALTQVTIDGRPCTGVTMVGSYSVGTNPQIQCTYMPGYGKQLAVSVQLFFQNMWTFAISWSSVGTAYVFSYDAPYATNLVAQGSNALGGYWATATLKNLGPRFNTLNYQPPMDQVQSDTTMPLPGWWGYNDMRLQLGNNIPITMWNITSDESASNGASVKFWIPSGCGAGLDLRVYRRNTWSMPNMGAGNSFSYAAPVVTCVGQPFNDPTRAGCTRVFIEGNNFGSSMNSTLMNITFWSATNQYHGQCDDVEYQPGSDYVRVSCRIPSSAVPNDTVRVTNECGQSSGSSVSEARGLSVSAASAPTLPSSIQLAGCGSAYAVGSSQSFSYAINAPMAPATEIRTDTITKVQLHQGGEWKDQVLSNGLFIGLVLPLILLVVIVYPIYVCLAGRKQVGGAWNSSAAAGSSSSAAAAGDKTVTKGATRVTMNPVSFAPAPPVKPAEAPGAVHDNL